MGASLKFSNIGKNLNKIIYMIITNQNILRYIEYTNTDPTDNPLSSSKPDIKTSLINKKIILTPFNNKVLVNEDVFLFIYPLSGNLQQRPSGRHTFVIDIVCPLTYWLIGSQMRPFEIADEISRTIDGQHVAGIGEVNINDYKLSKVNENYCAVSLFLIVEGSTLKERF